MIIAMGTVVAMLLGMKLCTPRFRYRDDVVKCCCFFREEEEESLNFLHQESAFDIFQSQEK